MELDASLFEYVRVRKLLPFQRLHLQRSLSDNPYPTVPLRRSYPKGFI